MNGKTIVIDSLARSGTTLLSAILGSQPRSFSLNGLFVEPMACDAAASIQWPIGYAMANPSSDLPTDLVKLKTQTLNTLIKNPHLRGGLGMAFWERILKKSYTESDSLYKTIRNELNVDNLFLRWNQCLFWHPNWITRNNNYWITVIRNPLDRIVSNMKTHDWLFDDAVNVTKIYMGNLLKLQNSIGIVYYEDLISKPSQVVKAIYHHCGIPEAEINLKDLIGADGLRYRDQGWRIRMKKGNHIVGEDFQGLHRNSVNQYRDYLSAEQISTCKCLLDNELLSRYL